MFSGRSGWLFYQPPRIREQVIAINLGGALIPLAVDLFLLPRAPLEPLLGAVAGVAAVSYALARPAWPVGIVLPRFVPPLAAALLPEVLAPGAAPVVAYIAGTLGTLVGADLLGVRYGSRPTRDSVTGNRLRIETHVAPHHQLAASTPAS